MVAVGLLKLPYLSISLGQYFTRVAQAFLAARGLGQGKPVASQGNGAVRLLRKQVRPSQRHFSGRQGKDVFAALGRCPRQQAVAQRLQVVALVNKQLAQAGFVQRDAAQVAQPAVQPHRPPVVAQGDGPFFQLLIGVGQQAHRRRHHMFVALFLRIGERSLQRGQRIRIVAELQVGVTNYQLQTGLAHLVVGLFGIPQALQRRTQGRSGILLHHFNHAQL